MSLPSGAPIARWIFEPLPAEVEQSLARLAAVPDAARLAVMPDVHLASEVCVGVALATRARPDHRFALGVSELLIGDPEHVHLDTRG